MDSASSTAPAPREAVGLRCDDGVVEITDAEVLGPGGELLCERFLGRVLNVEGVDSIALDRDRATAVIRHHCGDGGPSRFIERLSAAIRGGSLPAAFSSLPAGLLHSIGTIFRNG